MSNQKIQFTELDSKFINEFPLIVDVFVSTMTKINKLLAEQFGILKETVEDGIKNKKGWILSGKNSGEGFHWPFYETSNKTYSINNLTPYYKIESYQKVIKGKEDKPDNFFWVCTGFYYDSDISKFPFLYYYVSKGNCNKSGGPNMSLSFYNKIKALHKTAVIEHPDQNSKNESIELQCAEFSSESIKQTFDYYLDEIIKPYLKQLK